MPDARLLMRPNKRNALERCVSLRPAEMAGIWLRLLNKLEFGGVSCEVSTSSVAAATASPPPGLPAQGKAKEQLRQSLYLEGKVAERSEVG